MNIQRVVTIFALFILVNYIFFKTPVAQKVFLPIECDEAFKERERLIYTTDYAKMKNMTIKETEKEFLQKKTVIYAFNKENQLQGCKSMILNNKIWFKNIE